MLSGAEESRFRGDRITTCKLLRGHDDINVDQFFEVRR